jgi:glutamine synthetase
MKRFEANIKAQKVASLESIIRDLEGMTAALSQQIAAEEERTKVRDARRVDYSTVALAAAARRSKSMVSLADLRAALERARRDHATAAVEVRDLELARGGVSSELQHGTDQPQTVARSGKADL